MCRIKILKYIVPLYVSLLIVFISSANAYILRGEHVLQLMIEKNNFPARLLINQQVSSLYQDFETPGMEYDQKVWYQFPGEFRSDIDANGLIRIHVVSSDNSLTVVDGKIASESEAWEDHYKDIFFYRNRTRLVGKLESLGINFSVISLGRFNGAICYIIGAEYPDENKPQLWVAKDTFQPMRWIFEVSEAEGVVESKEIRYSDWTKYYNSRYPSKIEFFQGQNLIRSISVLQVEINPSIPGDLFDVERLRQQYMAEDREEDSTGQNDIEKRIEEFKKIYE